MTARLQKPDPFDGIEMALETDIMPALMRHEQARAAKVTRMILALSAFAIIVLGLATFAYNRAGTMPAVQWLLILGLGGGSLIYGLMTKSLKAQAKDILAGGLTDYVGWDFTAKDFKSLSVSEFRRLALLPMFGRQDKLEDRITGHVGKAKFIMHELRLATKGKNKTVHFDGQVFVVECSRKYTGETLVLREKGAIGRAITQKISGMKRAGFADPVFEKKFEVYTTDQVEARYLLPPDFMQRILDLESSVGGKNIRFAFSGGLLYIALETGNSFEPGSAFTSYQDRAPARKIIAELRAIHALVDGLSF